MMTLWEVLQGVGFFVVVGLIARGAVRRQQRRAPQAERSWTAEGLVPRPRSARQDETAETHEA